MSKVPDNVRLLLPDRLVGSIDLSRVIKELTVLDDALHQTTLRAPGKSVKLPKTTPTLEALAEVNKISLLEQRHRTALLSALSVYQKRAPKVHMSFTVEPSPRLLQELIIWLRKNINESLLLDTGLQPNIVAGCVIRTPNKVFDLTLRNNIAKQTPVLMKAIGGREA